MSSARAVFDLAVSTAGAVDGAISAHTVALGGTGGGGVTVRLDAGRGLAVKAGGFADLARSRDLDGLQAFTVEVSSSFHQMWPYGQASTSCFCPFALIGSMMTMPSSRLVMAPSRAALMHGASSQWLHSVGT